MSGRLPRINSIEGLAEFWDVHDFTDFEHECEEVMEPVFVQVKGFGLQAATQSRIASHAGQHGSHVGKYQDLLKRILIGVGDANIAFNDLRQLLKRLGFEERIRGSHHMFRRAGIQEKLNLQRDGNKAKPYQVRQVRAIIVRHKLADEL